MAALSVFTCTKADATAGGHTVCTYTGTITSGATPLIVGMPIIVIGFATANFNGFLVITGGNLTTTFTATIPAQNSSETNAATATVDPEGVQSVPTADTPNPFGFGVQRAVEPTASVPLGNIVGGINISGLGQIYPTGQQ